MAAVDYDAYVTCEPGTCEDCDFIAVLVARVKRLTADMKEYAEMCNCGAAYRENSKDDHYSFCVGQVAREAIKEEPVLNICLL